jgi:hypothetical protein
MESSNHYSARQNPKNELCNLHKDFETKDVFENQNQVQKKQSETLENEI